VDWHSYLSIEDYGDPETVNYFKERYSGISGRFDPHYIFEEFDLIMPLIERIWDTLQSGGERNYCLLDKGLGNAFMRIGVERRKLSLAKFLKYMANLQAERMMGSGRLPFSIDWPQDIRSYLSSTPNASR